MLDQEKVALITDLEKSMRSFIRDFRRQLNEVLGENFTSSEFSFLRAISEDKEQRVTSLAALLNVSNSHATSITDRLVEKELITRERSTVDRRAVVLALSEKGEALFKALDQKRAAYMNERFEKLTKEEIRLMIDIFSRL
ncbi:MarR family winged helix-turn-helix transcriptional regulator [Thalassobacillus hwangdonensis]|uniref:MarR family winged helix-turn-helix transcriptional regulator n=1 Tax=Thalassobacillus hwangdonensis TaxID=546108 RepID=A0ABW3L5Q6_9BACI